MKKVARSCQISEFFLSNSGKLGGRNERNAINSGFPVNSQSSSARLGLNTENSPSVFRSCVPKSFLGLVGMWHGAGVGGRDVTPVKWGEDLECV